MTELKVTSVSELKKLMEGEVIELPPFFPNTTFSAKLKRVTLKGLMKADKIPNPLLVTVGNLFSKTKNDKDDPENVPSELEVEGFNKFIDIVVAECLVEPNTEELQKSAIELTDEQKMFIFSYAHTGVHEVNSFCKKA